VEGFAHCSDPGTVHLPANRLFAGRADLVLLEIDPAKVDVRWEPGVPPSPDGVWFPHVYGPIPPSAVVAVHDFPPGADGFRLPAALANPDGDVELAIRAVHAGCEVVRSRYRGPLQRFAKAPLDFATDADHAAERAIMAVLRESR